MPEQQPSVSPAFAATPTNPNLPFNMPPATNTVAPPPATEQPPLPDQAPPIAPVQTQPQPQAQPQVQQPQYSPQDQAAALQRLTQQQQYAQMQQQFAQMQQQNAALQQRLQTQDATIDNLLKMQDEYDQLRQQAAAGQLDFGDLATIDAEDARKIGASIMKAVADQYAPLQQQMQQQLAQQQQYLQQSAQWQETRYKQQRLQDTLSKVMEKHPDFVALQTDPSFLNYVNQRDGHSSQTRDARARFEFENGNVDYLVHLVDDFKAQRPAASQITSVAPVQTATAPVTPAAPPQQLPTLKELNDLMQMRQITPDQYRSLVQQVRAAYNQQG